MILYLNIKSCSTIMLVESISLAMEKARLGNRARLARMDRACFSTCSWGGLRLIVGINCNNLLIAPPSTNHSQHCFECSVATSASMNMEKPDELYRIASPKFYSQGPKCSTSIIPLHRFSTIILCRSITKTTKHLGHVLPGLLNLNPIGLNPRP